MSIEYITSEPIRKLVDESLAKFLLVKMNQEALHRMEASLVNLYQWLHSRGYVQDEIQPSMVSLKWNPESRVVEPVNVYTEALLNGCVRVPDDVRSLETLKIGDMGIPLPPVKRLSRYDLA